MQQHVAVLLRGGAHAQGVGHEGAVLAVGLVDGSGQVGDEPAHPPVVLLAAGQEEQLVPGVEVHQGPAAGRHGGQVAEMFAHEHAFDEIFPQPAVVEPTILLHRQQGKVPGEGPGEHAGADIAGHALLRVDLDPVEAAARRILFEDEAAQPLLFELFDPGCGPGLHLLGVVDPAAAGHQPGRLLAAHQAQGLAGNGQAAFHLRADRHELHVLAENITNEVVQLMAAVVAHVLPQQAGAHPDFQFFHGCCPRCAERW